jgi:hypothetical protein
VRVNGQRIDPSVQVWRVWSYRASICVRTQV